MPKGKCKLCLKDEELQKSHLIPAGVFKSLRSEGEDCTSVTAKKIVMTSRQFQAHLLCHNCEDRLNKGGETWVLKHMARQIPQMQFPLFDLLNEAIIFDADDDSRTYDTSAVHAIDTSKLAYFGISMIWRTSTH